MIEKIPTEIWSLIFKLLDAKTLAIASQVCKNWQAIIQQCYIDMSRKQLRLNNSSIFQFWETHHSELNKLAKELNDALRFPHPKTSFWEEWDYLAFDFIENKTQLMIKPLLSQKAYPVVKIIQRFITNGYDVNQQDGFGYSLLHYLLFAKKFLASKYLLRTDTLILPDTKDRKWDATPLAHAIDTNDLELIELVLQKGANPNLDPLSHTLGNNPENSPHNLQEFLDSDYHGNAKKIIALLLKYGFKITEEMNAALSKENKKMIDEIKINLDQSTTDQSIHATKRQKCTR